MSRQAQNMILGGLAFAVGIVGMVAVFLLMTGGDGTTTAGAPLTPGVSADGSTEASADGSATSVGADSDAAAAADGASSGGLTGTQPKTVEPLAIPATPSTAVPLITTSTLAPTTTVAPTTAPPTTEATTTTAAATETTAAMTDTTMSDTETTMSDTTMADSTETTADPESPTSTEPSGETTTTEARESTTTTAPTTEVTEAPAGLNAVELEIARLTNELRTNPNGPLRREGPVIDCDGRVRVTNGQYDPIGAVEISEVASIQVARPWSAQMTRQNFQHQANAGVPALQAAGISVRSAGENIAYHSYPDKAMTHFAGWRESDGHFCNMMDPGFTHLGVGEVSKDDGISYATQNFFSIR